MVNKEEINGYFLEAVRRLKAKGYTQKDIVEAAGLSQNAISKIKTGQNNVGDGTINKLCAAFNLNPDFFYRGSKQFVIGEESHLPSSVCTIDTGSAINAIIAAKDEAIASLKRELASKDETIKAKDEQVESLAQLAEERLHRIAELRRIIDANNIAMTNYPFPIGTAEGNHREQKNL